MPQYSFAPSTDSADNTLGNEGFRQLFNNLSQNVEYRRKMQAEKGAQATKLRQMQAAGMLPKGNINLTDEGIEFDNEQAKNAYYAVLGGMMGDEPMDRAGGTSSTTQVDRGDKQFDRRVAQAEASTDPELENRMRQNVATLSDQALTLRADGANPITDPSQRREVANEVQSQARENLGLAAETSREGLKATTESATQGLQAANNIATQMADKAAERRQASAPTTTTTAPANAAQKPESMDAMRTSIRSEAGGTARTDVSQKVSERDQVNFKYKGKDIEVSNPVIATTTTQRVGERIDDVKTSLKNLLGLSAFSDAASSMSAAAGNLASSNNAFGALAKRRAEQIDRWEKDATLDGVTQKAEQVGTNLYKVGGMTAEGSAAASGSIAPKTFIDASQKNRFDVKSQGAIGSEDGTNPALGKLKGASGNEIETVSDDKGNHKFNGGDLSGADKAAIYRRNGADLPGWRVTNTYKDKRPYVVIKGPNNQYIQGWEAAGGGLTGVEGFITRSTASSAFQGQSSNKQGSASETAHSNDYNAAGVLKSQSEAQIKAKEAEKAKNK
jgi:hypothetical protein